MPGHQKSAFEFLRSPTVYRGSLQLLIEEDARSAWSRPVPTGRRGKPFVYSDSLIFSSLLVKNYYQLPYRMTAALFADLLQWLEVPISPPDHATLYYRNSRMEPPPAAANTETSCVVVNHAGVHWVNGYDPPPDPSACHAVRFRVDAGRKEMVMEYRRRLETVERSLSELTQNTTVARSRLDRQDNTFSTWDD